LEQNTDRFLYYDHPNIELFVKVIQLNPRSPPTLLSELLNENLDTFVVRMEGKCTDSNQINLCHDMAKGLQYLHRSGVIHKNLHGRNVLITSNGAAKIADYVSPQVISLSVTRTIPPANIAYLPPEVIEDKAQYSDQSDIYSLGVLFMQTVTQKIPSLTEKAKSSIVAKRKEEVYKIKYHTLLPTLLWCLNTSKSARPFVDQVCEAIAVVKYTPQDVMFTSSNWTVSTAVSNNFVSKVHFHSIYTDSV